MTDSDRQYTTTQDDAELLSKQNKLTNADDEPTQSKLATDTMDITEGGDTVDNSYASSQNEPVPVVKDEVPVEQPNDAMDPDSDKMLQQDEREAIDRSNILKGDRTRHATKPAGTYREPGDEEGLPGPNDGTSNVRGTGVEGAYDNKPNAPDPYVH